MIDLNQRFGKDQLPWAEYRGKLDAAVTLAKTLGFPVGLGADELKLILELADSGYHFIKYQREQAFQPLTPTIVVEEQPPAISSQPEEDLMAPPKHKIADIKAALQRSRDAKAARERAAREAAEQALNGGASVSPSEAVPRSDEAQSS